MLHKGKFYDADTAIVVDGQTLNWWLPAMTTYNASVDYRFDAFGSNTRVRLGVNNLTDERGQLYHDVSDFEPFFGRQRTSVIRPREYGIRFIKHWGR